MKRKSRASKQEYCLRHRPETPRGFSPYRLLDPGGAEVGEVNEFLDAQATRGLSVRSLRAYGYSLLNFWRWITKEGKDLPTLQEADLLDYIRFQKRGSGNQNTEVAPKTVNHRLTVVRSLYRFHSGHDIPGGRGSYRSRSHPYHNTAGAGAGYLHPSRPRIPQLRVKTPRRIVVPLEREEVRAFLENLRTWRDLSITALMLFCGLRSREVIELTLDDLQLSPGQIRVRGKGEKDRVLPLPNQVISPLGRYLEIERPQTPTQSIFLCLKGKKRGQAMTPSGLRSLFRYHRVSASVPKANPHRFRHTFGADMVRAGISLPALMKLMGHSDIHTTMLYVELSPKDVFEEFQRVLETLPTKETLSRKKLKWQEIS